MATDNNDSTNQGNEIYNYTTSDDPAVFKNIKAQRKGNAPMQAGGFTSQYIENWINDRLSQNDIMKDPTKIHQESNVKPLSKFDIDKATLMNLGLSAN